MLNCFQEALEPSIRLARMATLLKILLILHIALMIIDGFVLSTAWSAFLSVPMVVLIFAINSKYFGHLLLIIFICSYNIYFYISNIGAWFQVGFYKNDSSLVFGFLSFIIIFEIFFIYVIFQTYKQAKHEYRIKLGYAPGDIPNQNIFQMNNLEGLNNNFNNGDNNN